MEISKQSHAQAAVELLAYAAFFMLAFLATLAVFMQLEQQELSRAEHAYAQEIAYEFADHIQIAFIAGPGYWENVSLPPSLYGKPYKLMVSRGGQPQAGETGFVYVEWSGPMRVSSFSAPTITTAYDVQTYGSFLNTSFDYIVINPSADPSAKLIISNEAGRIKFTRGV